MSYDVITHEKLDAVLEVLKDIRNNLAYVAVNNIQKVESILHSNNTESTVVRKRGKEKENE